MQIDTGKAYTLFLFQFNVSFIYLGVTLAWKMIGAARGVLLLGEEATAAIVAIAAGLVWSLVMVSGWLNTERQLNVRAATVHEKVNKANSPLLHFELIDRGNNLLHHSP